jgi:hypothetical protein
LAVLVLRVEHFHSAGFELGRGAHIEQLEDVALDIDNSVVEAVPLLQFPGPAGKLVNRQRP